MRKLKILLMTAIMVIGLAVPSLADDLKVDVNIYKDGTYEPGIPSMAQKSVKGAHITEENGVKKLVVETKYFELLGFYGTLKQIKYLGDDGNFIFSTENLATPVLDGEVKLDLNDTSYNALMNNGSVELLGGEVLSDVSYGSWHVPGGFKAVDFVISKQQ